MNATTTPLFRKVEKGQVLITVRGFYSQADLYNRGEELFACLKQGFVRLLSGDSTTAKGIRWKAIEGINYVEEFNGPKLVLGRPPKQLKVAGGTNAQI
ncbi:MAG: hypothetical protein E5Y34_11130 [Mesorhizobium sp.]|uniref:hypothetical protein n=1 Tax=Mesorhizobium sp. TaxID=1871066 RepID=UPI001215CD12|nr:hypothetical protein [Mesorhizobium sp.]TIN01001.1 MAG: hypothetical protein E5Y34_11130 [Mesorhizobium sp.]